MSETEVERDTEELARAAERAALRLANADAETRNDALRSIADAIRDRKAAILEANADDVAEAETMLDRGEYTQALVDRLTLDETKIESIASMVESVAEQDDPLGETLAARELDADLELYRVSVPIGVVAAVFESRPDALVQIAALALKSGNAVVLKGGSEAAASNRILYETIIEATPEIADGWAALIEAHEAVDRLLELDDRVDLVMPRGSSAFVSHVQEATQIPVLGHTEGLCHVYVDEAADVDEAVDVAYDAKVQYPAVCNAVETLLVHESVAAEFLPAVVERYATADVTLRGDERTREVVDVDPATDADWDTEYGEA